MQGHVGGYCEVWHANGPVEPVEAACNWSERVSCQVKGGLSVKCSVVKIYDVHSTRQVS